jgi:hypothetical protein
MMQAYKIKGSIDRSGQLIVTEPINLAPGEVEVIVLRQSSTEDNSVSADGTETATPKRRKTIVKAFQDLFDNTEPVPPDFDADQARWEALKEKHDL